MKNQPDIDELLSGFIDDELTPREKTQIQRLMTNDPTIAARIDKLRKTRQLYGSLPVSEAPRDLAENVAILLERQTLLTKPEPVLDQTDRRRGARSLFYRKVFAAAAMFALVAVLGGVIYSIIAPKPPAGLPVASMGTDPSVVAPEPASPAMKFTGRLELRTANLVTVDAAVTKAIAANSLIKHEVERLDDSSRYTIKCSQRGLEALLIDLGEVWDSFTSASLFVETDAFARPVVVDAVTPAQISTIAMQDNFQKSIQVAKNYALLNGMGENALHGVGGPIPDIIPIIEPRLTSGGGASNGDIEAENMNLVLVVIETD